MQPFNLAQAIIQSLLTILLPILIGIVCWIYRLYTQRLPEHQIPHLLIFSRIAVQYVEQEHKNALDKKKLASAYCADLFSMRKLPIPSDREIEIAIGSAMFETNGLSSKQEE
jgi:hypothetical protein